MNHYMFSKKGELVKFIIHNKKRSEKLEQLREVFEPRFSWHEVNILYFSCTFTFAKFVSIYLHSILKTIPWPNGFRWQKIQ